MSPSLTEGSGADTSRLEAVQTRIKKQYEHFLPVVEELGLHGVRVIRRKLDELDQDGDQQGDLQPIVYPRVKSLRSCLLRLEEYAKDSISDLPDFLGFRVVILDRAQQGEVASSLTELTRGKNFSEYFYSDDRGRASGFAGLIATDVGMQRLMDLVPGEASRASHALEDDFGSVELSDLRWELQVQSVMQEAWSRVSHRNHYKSSSGVPLASSRRLLRLAPVLDLIDGEMSLIRRDLPNEKEQATQLIVKALRERGAAEVALDEHALVVVGRLRSVDFTALRDAGRAAGMQRSGWPELVRVGRDTEVCLSVCASTGVEDVETFANLVAQYASNLKASASLLEQVMGTREGDPAFHASAPYDRPLLVFSVLRLLQSTHPVARVEAMSDELWDRVSKVRGAKS